MHHVVVRRDRYADSGCEDVGLMVTMIYRGHSHVWEDDSFVGKLVGNAVTGEMYFAMGEIVVPMAERA